MGKRQFKTTLEGELLRLDEAKTSKRRERVIDGFQDGKALIGETTVELFNSNDYLGLRHHKALKEAEEAATRHYGTGPGAVRFISGTMKIHRDLEAAVARFHGREEAMVVSSAFATNVGVLMAMIKGQSQGSLVSAKTLVISDELNHRSIIEGIRVANLDSGSKQIFKHRDMEDLAAILAQAVGKFDRVLVVTDGVFSMLGVYQDLKMLQKVAEQYDGSFPEGVWIVVDDAHGVGAFGATGRGTEEASGGRADLLIGTFGKAFGADGGYVVGDKVVIDYLRESVATYIYSNSIAPGTAGAALAALRLMARPEGQTLTRTLRENVEYFKTLAEANGLVLAADSIHPIQPVLMGDPARAKQASLDLFENGFWVTPISYPVVSQGKDELRVQISASHTKRTIEELVLAIKAV